MQQISVRSMIQAPKGKILVAFDLSQAESWVVAHRAEEHTMIHALKFGDIHTETAGSAIFHRNVGCGHDWKKNKELKNHVCVKCGRAVSSEMRYLGKQYNHASSYRMKAQKAAEVINKRSDKPPYITVTITQSRAYSAAWHEFYNVKGWWAEIEHQLGINRTLTTVHGVERTFFEAWGDDLFKEATAFEPQCTVADHFNGAVQDEVGVEGGLLLIFEKLIDDYNDRKIIHQAHDSAVLEIPIGDEDELIPQIKHYMLRPMIIKGRDFIIPVDIEIGDRYGELEKVA